MNSDSKKTTPLMRQYYGVKQRHPDKILLFRMGDFYETFDEDAKLAAKVLNITLTKRSNGAAGQTPLAGFPHHALDNYLHKLLKAGLKVAVCEQLEDPKQAKGLVKRDVTEIITPGTAVNDKYLENSENNFLGILQIQDSQIDYAYCDVSTGQFYYVRGAIDKLIPFIESTPPAELLCMEGQSLAIKKHLPYFRGLITEMPEWIFDPVYAKDLISTQFKLQSLRGVGLDDSHSSLGVIGVALHYLKENFQKSLAHIQSIRQQVLDDIVGLDQYSIRNLELFRRLSGETGEGTLIWALDYTMSSMGSRYLR
ncbi:MAG: DNA mismatch repair protein MutS, partial [Candidatus Marinimicrobia bacterium]|nr:DNA mismatch repair protein MutS [Candidatus Neomarinimicrobiota bacterium]